MANATLVADIDADLKQRMERIAALDRRPVSILAGDVIRNFVEEREATRELVRLGLELAREGVAMSEEDIDAWLKAPMEAEFPAASSP